MAILVETGDYSPNTSSAFTRLNVYCGLDCCVTLECDDAHQELHDSVSRKTMEFEHRAGVLALCLSLRGLLVDRGERDKLLITFEARAKRVEALLNRFSAAVWDRPLNPRSPDQLKAFFYGCMKIKPVVEKFKGVEKITTNRKALEKIAKSHIHARIFVNTILYLRDLSKMISVLRGGVDEDWRMRFSYNPAGTETGRWSSRKNPLGGGMNGQNITDELRRIFIPDKGFFFAYVDGEQAESRGVAYYSDDADYISACESADLHSTVTQMLWPGVDPKSQFYRHFSHRDISKRAGHGSNYRGKPYGIGLQIGVEVSVLEKFQRLYFSRFPGIPRWHLRVAQELQRTRRLTNVFGRRRQFFGRPYEDETLKEAIAHLPQSTVADYIDEGILRVFETYDRGDPNADLRVVGQLHDAGLFLIREGREDLIPAIKSLMAFPVEFPSGKKMVIPMDAKVGYNWASETKENPNGLGKSLSGKSRILGNILDAVL